MSTVVFCEGRHDVDFLSRIHRTHNGKNFDTFIDRESEDQQDTRVRQHKLDSKIEYLYKAEGGRSEVIKKFRSHATEFGGYNLFLLVDFDLKGKSNFIDNLHNSLDEHYHGAVRVNPHKTAENQHMMLYDCDLVVNGDVDDDFHLMAFKDDLEAVTNIKKGEKRPEQLRKINIYIDNHSGIVRDIYNTLY